MSDKFLPSLASAARIVRSQNGNISTADFTTLCDHIIRIFDHLGTFMYYAKVEMTSKTSTLKDVADQLTTLSEVVAADKAAGKVTTKNSCTRNLHRLMLSLSYLRVLLQKLLNDPKIALATATWEAYDVTLGTIHTFVVRQAVWAGTFALPTRQYFLDSIGETEESAREPALDFIQSATVIASALEVLFDVVMPISDVTTLPAIPGVVPL